MRYEILKDGEVVNTIVADEAFVADYCEKNGYTHRQLPDPVPRPEPELPTELEQLRAANVSLQNQVNMLNLSASQTAQTQQIISALTPTV